MSFKKLFFFSFSLLLLSIFFLSAKLFSQNIFWTDNFNSGCTSNCPASSYNSPNGQWLVTDIGTQGFVSNNWFVSCAENGNGVNNCSSPCGSSATLHVGENFWPNFDIGATYNKGGNMSNNSATNKRAVSPIISTIGKTTITLNFLFIENGNTSNDDGWVEYSINGGSSWNLLSNTAKTSICGSGDGIWTQYSSVLPIACENIPNLKIGFVWINNNDGTGTDPSFAIDDVTLSTPSSGGSAPVADFIANSTTICVGQCVNFADLSTNTPTSWSWTFSGSSTSSSSVQNPTNICYPSAGTFNVSLTSTNANGTDTETKTNYITVISSSSAPGNISGPDTVCSGQSNVSFSIAPVGGAISYSWIVPAGTVLVSGQGTTTIAVNFANNGGNICASAVNACGSSSQSCLSVYVDPCTAPPVANFSANDTSICQNGCIIFFDMSSNGASSWNWIFSGATPASSSFQNPTNICYPNSGTYPVTLIVSNVAGTDTLIKSSYITVQPGPIISAGPDTSVAVGAPVQLNASGGINYSWTPATFLSATNISNPVSSPTAPITYTVFATDANGCSSYDTVRIEMIYKNILWVPQAFSPNGDGLNDILFAHATNVKNFYFVVFNRWEEKVFETDDPLKGWDGTVKGEIVNTGIFLYYARVEFMDETKDEKKGNVMLMK